MWLLGAAIQRVSSVRVYGRFAWQAWGLWQRVRGAGSRAGVSRGRRGTPDARGRLGGRWAVDSLGRCGESCILTLLRVRFAWQVWEWWPSESPRARALSRDRRGDSCTRRAFRVAGVGNGATCCVAGHRFAWQAQGIAHGR